MRSTKFVSVLKKSFSWLFSGDLVYSYSVGVRGIQTIDILQRNKTTESAESVMLEFTVLPIGTQANSLCYRERKTHYA